MDLSISADFENRGRSRRRILTIRDSAQQLLFAKSMARPLRLHVPGMLHHVMSRGNDKREMFIDDVDYARYLRVLERSAERFGVEVVALCLMPNHVHLLVKPHQHPLSRMMQHLNGSYCGWFNRRHGRVGHVLQGRY